MEKTIPLHGAAPAWAKIKAAAESAGLTLTLRMIDGLPAFPDEVPEDGWNELRISGAAGMMTLRQSPDALSVVVWGNADPALQREWEILATACESSIVY